MTDDIINLERTSMAIDIPKRQISNRMAGMEMLQLQNRGGIHNEKIKEHELDIELKEAQMERLKILFNKLLSFLHPFILTKLPQYENKS